MRSSIITPPFPQSFRYLSDVTTTMYLLRMIKVCYFQAIYIPCMFCLRNTFEIYVGIRWKYDPCRKVSIPALFGRFFMSQFLCHHFIIMYFICINPLLQTPLDVFALHFYIYFIIYGGRAPVPFTPSTPTCFVHISFSQPHSNFPTD